MDSKSKILKKLRENFAGKPLKASPLSRDEIPDIIRDEKLYSDYISGADDMLQQFIERQEKLHGEVHTFISMAKMVKMLSEILQGFGFSSAKYFENKLLKQIFDIQPDIKNFFDPENNLNTDSPDFSKYEAGVSGAEFLISRTGSIFINSQMAGGRRLTVLPPVHIVLARQSQLVSSLDDVLQQISNADTSWSYATFITGPSRTSDIEKKLVLGAHGPKRLITMILKD